MADPAHQIRPRPKLAAYLFERRLTFRDGAQLFECSHEKVRKWCLAFDDPSRVIPREDDLARIVERTGGAVTAEDFYPAHLTRQRDCEAVQ